MMDKTVLKAVVKLAEQTERIVRNQEVIIDHLTAVKNHLTGETATDRYRRNEVCRSDCTHYRQEGGNGVEF